MSKKSSILWNSMKGNRLRYVGAVLSVGISTGLGLLPPLVIRGTIDSIIGGKPMDMPAWVIGIIEKIGGQKVLVQNLWICGILLIMITLLNGLFQYTKGKWSAEASEAIARNIRDGLYDHLQNLPYDYHVKSETGDLMQRCTSDVETVRRFFATQFVEMGRALFMLFMSLAIMLSLNVKMTLMCMIVVPIIFTFAFIFFSRIKKTFKKSDEAESRMSITLQENLTGVRVVRAFGRQAFEMDKFDEKSREYKDLTFRLIKLLAAYWAMSDFLVMLQIGIVLTVGVYQATSGAISLGTLVVFTSYESMLLWPIRQMGRILTDMGKASVSLGRISEILNTPLEGEGESLLKPEITGNIEFRNVTFGYDDGKPVLSNISFKVKQGQTVAILGPTGSGKSSLVHLLQRLYDYKSGSVLIDGVELKSIDRKWLRKNIGIVLQEPFLYSKTIKENIALAKEDAQDEEVYNAAKVASIHDVIEEFENGYETAVGEKGVTLSGGQKQRVAIARTIVPECPVLIFDDSLSAVDTETDAEIRKRLKERSKNATTFIISHRITTLAGADIIVVLDHGRVVQIGNHEELIKQPGLYRRVWAIQNSLEQEFEYEAQEGLMNGAACGR